MRNQKTTRDTVANPSYPPGPMLQPDEMRQTNTRPSKAMQDVVNAKTNTSLTFTELAPGVWEVDSGRMGPRCVLLGGNHGNEPSGVSAVMRLLHEYTMGARELASGKVVLAVGNEDAVLMNKREVSYNLNRLFLAEPKEGSDPELLRARELQNVLFEPGSLLVDLHSTSQASRPFVMVESDRVDEASWVPVATVLCGTPEHWDRYLMGTTQCYARTKGVTAFTVECGQHDQESTAEVAYATAEAFLRAYLTQEPHKVPFNDDRLVVEFSEVVPKEDESFRFARKFEGFDLLSEGELVGSGDLGEHRATEDCVMVFPTDPTTVKLGADLYFLGRALSTGHPPGMSRQDV